VNECDLDTGALAWRPAKVRSHARRATVQLVAAGIDPFYVAEKAIGTRSKTTSTGTCKSCRRSSAWRGSSGRPGSSTIRYRRKLPLDASLPWRSKGTTNRLPSGKTCLEPLCGTCCSAEGLSLHLATEALHREVPSHPSRPSSAHRHGHLSALRPRAV